MINLTLKDGSVKKVESGKTVLEIAKDQALALKIKAEELVELAKEKGTPVLEKASEEVREKTLAVLKEVEKKLKK